MKIISILFFILGCTQQDYFYFFEKAPTYNFRAEDYLNLQEHQLSTVSKNNKIIKNFKLPFSIKYIEMPFDLVIGLDDPQYSMIEILNVEYKNKLLWLTLESLNDGRQIIGLPKKIDAQKHIIDFATKMNIPTYKSNLSVKQSVEKIEVSFIQENYINRNKKNIAFEVRYQKDVLEKSNGIFMPKNKTHTFERNSSAMNHSASNFMAVIDIHRSLTPMQSSQLQFTDRSYPKLRLKKILGTPVLSIISQNIAAIGPHQTKMKADQQQLYLNKNNEMTKLTIKQNEEIKVILKFNPPIPTLTSKNFPKKSRFTLEMFNKNNGNLMLLGTIKQKRLGNYKVIYTLGVDDRPSLQNKINQTPHWFFERSIFTSIDQNGFIQSTLMSPGDTNINTQEVAIGRPSNSTIKLIKPVKLNKKNQNTKQPNFLNMPLKLEKCESIEQIDHYIISSNIIPLRLSLSDYPFDNKNPTSVWALHQLKIKTKKKWTQKEIKALLSDFEILPGPHPIENGLKLDSLEIEIVHNKKTLPNGSEINGISYYQDESELVIPIFVRILVSPRSATPFSSQHMKVIRNFNALATVKIAILPEIIELRDHAFPRCKISSDLNKHRKVFLK